MISSENRYALFRIMLQAITRYARPLHARIVQSLKLAKAAISAGNEVRLSCLNEEDFGCEN